MYDHPEVAVAHDALWSAIRDALRRDGHNAPETLNRRIGMWEGWQSPDLVLGQACGLPYRSRLHPDVTLLASFDYGLPDIPPGFYVSHVVSRKGDATDLVAYRGRTLVINGYDSQSGWSGIADLASQHAVTFGHIQVSGAHRRSACAVADGNADLAAIDAITWRILERALPEMTGQLQIIAQTAPSPGMALITAPRHERTALRSAIKAGLDALPATHRDTLGISALVDIPKSTYLATPARIAV